MKKHRTSLNWLAASFVIIWISLSVASLAQAAADAREPVQLAKETDAAVVAGKSYDLVVVGGTPGGIACAVRAAREGLTVLLVQHNKPAGGMMTHALPQGDA